MVQAPEAVVQKSALLDADASSTGLVCGANSTKKSISPSLSISMHATETAALS